VNRVSTTRFTVIEEAALSREVGGEDVMLSQSHTQAAQRPCAAALSPSDSAERIRSRPSFGQTGWTGCPTPVEVSAFSS
jgi:hypothetical protein